MNKSKDATPSTHSGTAARPESGGGGVSALSKNKEIKKLLDMGVQRGFLTYVEVNELLPPEIISPESVDEIMALLVENEIEVFMGEKDPAS